VGQREMCEDTARLVYTMLSDVSVHYPLKASAHVKSDNINAATNMYFNVSFDVGSLHK